MFQSENEDLIPRCAPKPSASDLAVAEFHPSVPEISIVFTQKENGQLTCAPPTVITSYSVWKNRCLPSVGYSNETESLYTESATSKRSNVYPFQTGSVVVPPINYTAGQIALNKTDYAATVGKNAECTFKTPFSIESQTATFSPRGILTSSCNRKTENSVQQRQSQPFLSTHLEENVITISSGTQTDNCFNSAYESHIKNLATKDDIAEIKSLIVEMEMERRHLLEIVKKLLEEKLKLSSDKNRPESRDIGTQNDEQLTEGHLIQKPLHIRYDLHEDLTKNEDYDEQQKPNIQSTKMQTTCTAVVPAIPKTATEQSIVMNELAVKYLPNGKLNATQPDVFVGNKVRNQYDSPLKNIENLDKNPTDLSTASYKYLRKYRLLPEENHNFCSQRKLNSEDHQENLLDLEMIRYKPKFI